MRLPRTSLLARLRGADVPPVILLEAPSGFGKSWLARRAVPDEVLRLRGDLGPLARPAAPHRSAVLIDDAHLLPPEQLDVLVERIEDADGDARLVLAGRLLPQQVHEAAQLVDGLIIDAESLRITPAEVLEALPSATDTLAERLVDAADGSVRVIATSLDQAVRDPSADPVAVASQMVRVAAEVALQQLSAHERSIVALLARAPGIDWHLLDQLGGDGFVARAVAAGIPLRRQLTGALDLSSASALRGTPIDPTTAAALAEDMLERGRALEAIALVLDAGEHDRAVEMMKGLSESVVETVEPRLLLSMLARLGSAVEREPALLLMRAGATRFLGQVDQAVADLDRAVRLAVDGDPRLRRRVAIEAARARLAEGRREEAERIARETLGELGEGEERTYARAHQVLADCASSSDAREDLQRAAESYRVAATAWESCGEFARARTCRVTLSLGVLTPLGRFDEALAQVGQLLATPDISDAERCYAIVTEGFVLFNANRLDSAELRFERIADLGYLYDNPRLIAAASWGMALVASRREDLAATLRWIATAQNTALGEDDDVLGVSFMCDAANMLGALGELDSAAMYLERAIARRPVYPGQVLSTKYMLECRRGNLGDYEAALRQTVPAALWQLKLLTAYALAIHGETDQARTMLDEATRELLALGFGDFASLGERRIHEELVGMLKGTAAPAAPDPAAAVRAPASTPTGRRLLVLGGPISVQEVNGDLVVVPPGNPQRLVGVVAANGGSATLDLVSDAIWPGDDVEASRARLRNVLLRLRRAVGDVVVRSGNGLRLAPGISCDLHEFERKAADALSTARADPDLAGELAQVAVAEGDMQVFVDFEYDEWAVSARRRVEQQLISLLDLLSVQAEDAGDLPQAQALAERALRLDRYTDSRYVRLAELLTLQNRVAAAMAVLDDAAAVARELGDGTPTAAKHRREELLRRAASGV
jgi:DNA-binding SARP family transcriptional activator